MSIDANNEMLNKVRKVIADYAELGINVESLAVDDDLFANGMSSRASVSVMLGLESEFDIEFPDAMLRRDVFESIHSISTAIESITASV
jgi:acyl carrier protein